MTPLPRTNAHSAWEADVGVVGARTTAHVLHLDPTDNWPLLPTCLDGLALYIDLTLSCDLHAMLLEAWRALRLGGLVVLVPTLTPSADTQERGRVAHWPGVARAVGFSIPPTLQSRSLFTGFLLRHHSWHMVQRALTPWTPPPLVLCKGNVHGLHPLYSAKRRDD